MDTEKQFRVIAIGNWVEKRRRFGPNNVVILPWFSVANKKVVNFSFKTVDGFTVLRVKPAFFFFRFNCEDFPACHSASFKSSPSALSTNYTQHTNRTRSHCVSFSFFPICLSSRTSETITPFKVRRRMLFCAIVHTVKSCDCVIRGLLNHDKITLLYLELQI